MEKEKGMNNLEFIKHIQKYIPTKCRTDDGCNFNLIKVHMLIDEFLNKKGNKCPSCGSINVRPYELHSHDNPDDSPLICNDCGYGT